MGASEPSIAFLWRGVYIAGIPKTFETTRLTVVVLCVADSEVVVNSGMLKVVVGFVLSRTPSTVVVVVDRGVVLTSPLPLPLHIGVVDGIPVRTKNNSI